MDANTGKLKMLAENEEVPEGMVEVLKEEMTAKQAETMQVSKHDNRSILGKKFTALRKGVKPFKPTKAQKRNRTRKELNEERKRYNLKNMA